MSDPTWPATLPNPLLSSYGLNPNLPLIRTEMEQGPQRVTRTSDQYTSIISTSILLSKAQLTTFQNFFDSDINAGADWFNITVITKGAAQLHRCRISGRPSHRLENHKFRINFSLETDERKS